MLRHRIAAAIVVMVAVGGTAAMAFAQTSDTATPPAVAAPAVPQDTCGKHYAARDHRALVRRSITESQYAVSKQARRAHVTEMSCPSTPEGRTAMQRDWRKALAAHRHYVHDVLSYGGGTNPLGTHKWATPYCIVVGESGAGSGSSNYYGLLDAWGVYGPRWAHESDAGSASFWAQSVAAYNTRQHGFGGWSTWPC